MNEFSCLDEARDVDEDRLSRSATEPNASGTHASSAILLQVPQFLQQTPVESPAGRRRGGSSARRGQSRGLASADWVGKTWGQTTKN